MMVSLPRSPVTATPEAVLLQPQPLAGSTVFLSATAGPTPGPLLAPGTRMERFTIIRHLGSGRGAHVYLAADDVRGHEVALKVADLHPATAHATETRMRREIDLRRRIGSHSNVLAVHDTHRIRCGGLDLFVVSMEHADGGDFRQWLTKTQNDPAARVEQGIPYLLQIARGLLALHAAGVVHLDVKPENAFWAQGVWKIGDLDHAWSIEELRALRPHGDLIQGDVRVLGTPGYLSPEVQEPGAARVDTRADVYSLGLVLRETLNVAEYLAHQHRVHGPRPAGPDLSRIIERCLRSDPNDRFQLVDHVIALLDTEALPARRGSRVSRWPLDDSRWRQARRCLAQGRMKDARRLCSTLLDGSPYHPGARAVMAQLDRHEHQMLDRARRLIGSPPDDVVDAVNELRRLVGVLPDYQETVQLVDSVEERLIACHAALVAAMKCLSTGHLSGFAEAMESASAWAPKDPTTVDTCVFSRNLLQYCRDRHSTITEAVDRRQYRRALHLVSRHRRLLSKLAGRSHQILANLDCGITTSEGRSQ